MVTLNSFESVNTNLGSSQNFANRVPFLDKRNLIQPTQYVNNPNAYDSRYNDQAKRYNKNQAPSHGSTSEAFFKSRNLMSPVYIHDEARTKYEMISSLPQKSSKIKEKIIRYF